MDRATVTRIKDLTERKCANCTAYHDGKSECRRYAPRPIVGLMLDTFRVVWPAVTEEDFCGEFTHRKR